MHFRLCRGNTAHHPGSLIAASSSRHLPQHDVRWRNESRWALRRARIDLRWTRSYHAISCSLCFFSTYLQISRSLIQFSLRDQDGQIVYDIHLDICLNQHTDRFRFWPGLEIADLPTFPFFILSKNVIASTAGSYRPRLTGLYRKKQSIVSLFI